MEAPANNTAASSSNDRDGREEFEEGDAISHKRDDFETTIQSDLIFWCDKQKEQSSTALSFLGGSAAEIKLHGHRFRFEFQGPTSSPLVVLHFEAPYVDGQFADSPPHPSTPSSSESSSIPRQTRYRTFDSAASASQNFQQALDAALEFARELKPINDHEEQIEQESNRLDPDIRESSVTVSSGGSLVMQAMQAKELCETAKVAVGAASEAVAGLLKDVLAPPSAILRSSPRSNARYLSIADAAACRAWLKCLRNAVDSGDFLHCCAVHIIGHGWEPSLFSVRCRIDLAQLLGVGSDMLGDGPSVAMGIIATKPLIIKLFIHMGDRDIIDLGKPTVYQNEGEEDTGRVSKASTVGEGMVGDTEMSVGRNIATSVVEEAMGRRREGNVFQNILQEVVTWYLGHWSFHI